jgi:hypothetical protein
MPSTSAYPSLGPGKSQNTPALTLGVGWQAVIAQITVLFYTRVDNPARKTSRLTSDDPACDRRHSAGRFHL